ncbi:chorion class B protein M2410-like [Ostrinia furnacalis]|uniref:chorion class B protein M2410-like n=1 Tax=Ostrinia furnacalis TaxID=93504 RepID=UPI00103A7A4E|nr:chorion class B protein M2410-like [Ostrinia furnacalis]
MAAKALLVICAQALLIQASIAQSISRLSGNSLVDNIVIGSAAPSYGTINLGGSGLASGFGSSSLYSGSLLGSSGLSSGIVGSGLANSGSNLINVGGSGLTVASGGPLIVTAISPIGPSGLAVATENAIEGILTVNGQLPYLSAVAFEGGLPTTGSGVATCGCGSGTVGITSEGFARGRGILY